MRTLNLGILAHVDAGKTSLTERLLHAAGVIDEVGRVDDGNTQTDSLALERQRGITIKSAVTTFELDAGTRTDPSADATGAITVNLIDTPGHPDFIAEVERVLSILDGAVLVVSAVEGVQAQTRLLLRALRRLDIPTLIFVNKIDRAGARDSTLMRDLAEKLSPSVIAMSSIDRLGHDDAVSTPYTGADAGFTASLLDLVSEHDDQLLAAYVADERALSYASLRAALAEQTRRVVVHPVFWGSAVTGAGVDGLIEGLTELLPARERDPDGAVSGTVFKVERGRAGEKVAYVQLESGTVREREWVRFRSPDAAESAEPEEAKVTTIAAFDRGTAAASTTLTAGRIGRLRGLGAVRIGDVLGVPPPVARAAQFARPTLETVVRSRRPGDGGRLHAALSQLTEQDPLINLRQDPLRGEVSVSLYGEVQKQVIESTLAEEYGIAVTFDETSTLHLERPVGSGANAEFMGEPGNPFRATVGLRVDPGPVDSGVVFRLEVELGSLPLSFVRAIEETVHLTLEQGLRGWRVSDCTVTLTHSGYYPPPPTGWSSASSSAGDFRSLTPLVVMNALREAGTAVHEPIQRFRLEFPTATYAALLPALTTLRAIPFSPSPKGPITLLEGEIPSAMVHRLELRLPGLTHGEGLLETWFDRWEPVRGPAPIRERGDHDPLNRKEYLRHIRR